MASNILASNTIITFFQKYWIIILFIILVIVLIIAYKKGKSSNLTNPDIFTYRYNSYNP